MLVCGQRAKLAHLTEHADEGPVRAVPGHFRRRFEHPGKGQGIGVIAVVDDQPPAHLRTGKTLLRQKRASESGGDLVRRQTEAMGHGSHGNDVLRAESSPERRFHIKGNAVQPQPEQALILSRRGDVGSAVIDLPPCGGKKDQLRMHGAGLAHEFGVVRADHGHAARREV